MECINCITLIWNVPFLWWSFQFRHYSFDNWKCHHDCIVQPMCVVFILNQILWYRQDITIKHNNTKITLNSLFRNFISNLRYCYYSELKKSLTFYLGSKPLIVSLYGFCKLFRKVNYEGWLLCTSQTTNYKLIIIVIINNSHKNTYSIEYYHYLQN